MPEPALQQLVAQTQWWEYGVLGAICLMFAYVIVFLFKRNERARDTADAKAEIERKAAESERKSMDNERLEWALERERWTIEREKIRADLAEKLARDIREVVTQAHANETAIRRENADMLESMSNETKRASDALVAMLQKFHDRAMAPRGGR